MGWVIASDEANERASVVVAGAVMMVGVSAGTANQSRPDARATVGTGAAVAAGATAALGFARLSLLFRWGQRTTTVPPTSSRRASC